MTESWRNILERAAENLSIELEQSTAPVFRHAHATPIGRASAGTRRLSPQLSFAESRDMLARELMALSAQMRSEKPATPPAVTALTVPVTASSQKKAQPKRPQSQRRAAWRNVIVVSVSGIIIGLAGYLLLDQMQSGQSFRVDHAEAKLAFPQHPSPFQQR
jgi:hypothetical protein